MRVFVGLGNPGEKYLDTRHNVGFAFLDKLSQKYESTFSSKKNFQISKLSDLILIKPTTFMNDSGVAVSEAVKNYKIKPENLFVVHDDLDLKLGTFKIQKGKGPKVHNGISSVEDHLKTNDFNRIRIGIDNREPESRIEGSIYVLSKFSKEEKEIIEEVLQEIIAKLGAEK